jgi:RNA polymerase sigma-70 factor (ECF subfamily)
MSVSTTDFENVYNKHYAEIRRFIFTIARRDPDITDDISQNVWQSAYRYFGTLRDEASVRSWLYAIARNEATRYFSNRHVVFFANALTIEGDGDSDAIDVIDEDDSAFPETLANNDLLAKLLGLLKEDEQRLILLYYAYDVDLKEIAEMGGTNYNTLKSIFRRIMEKLRKAAREMETEIR